MPEPPPAQTHAALERAARHRRARAVDHPGPTRFSEAALRERVVALPCRPRPATDGWWLVGRVLDGVADNEFLVWLHAPSDRVRLKERIVPPPDTAPPPRRPDGRYYDGARRRWIVPGAEDGPRPDASESAGTA